MIQELMRKKLASQPALKVFCLSPGIPTQSMVQHWATILKEFPARAKKPNQNIFIATLENLPDGVNVCFNERTVVITFEVHRVLGSDCIAIVSTERSLVALARSRAISLYGESRFQIRCMRDLQVALRNLRATASRPASPEGPTSNEV
jgi:hypothetical protein